MNSKCHLLIDCINPPFIYLLSELKFCRGRLYSNIEEENEENKLAVNEGSFLPDTIGDKPLRAMSKKSESLPTDMSDNSESETQQVQLIKPRGSKAGIVLNSPSLRPGNYLY